MLVATTEEDSVCSRLWKSTSRRRLPGKSHQPLDLSGAMPFDQKTRSEVPPGEEAGHRRTES